MSAIISAIIVNYNAGRLLRSCVDSLLNCPLEMQIIVVDNASTDDSLDTLLGLPRMQIIKNSTNVGFATASNCGARVASAQVMLFLNPDCSFESGVLVRLLRSLRVNEHVGMVGGFLANLNGTEQKGGRRAVPTPWRSFVRVSGLSCLASRWPKLFSDFYLHRQPLPDGPIEVEAISGACMMVSREAIEDVGLWDEGYFLHCEDLDWCMRFRQKGWKILFVPHARISHALGECSRNRRVFVEWHKHKGMIRFYLKFFRRQYPGVLVGLIMVGVWLRFGLIATCLTAKGIGRSLGFWLDDVDRSK